MELPANYLTRVNFGRDLFCFIISRWYNQSVTGCGGHAMEKHILYLFSIHLFLTNLRRHSIRGKQCDPMASLWGRKCWSSYEDETDILANPKDFFLIGHQVHDVHIVKRR